MGKRTPGEPDYPQTAEEAEAYCARFVAALREHLGGRLVCVLLCGSWARGEARPPDSDIDLTAIVDTVDAAALDALLGAWRQSTMGRANVYGADEVTVMSREAVEMYTVGARVLYGTNPFTPPTRADFAEDLARAAENVARNARGTALYFWMAVEEHVEGSRYLASKTAARWALKNLAAM